MAAPPDNPDAPQVLVRTDSAGATHTFAAACRAHGVGFSFGHPVDARVQDAVDTLNRGNCWYPAIESGGELRDGAWVAEATDLVDLSAWPAGTRLILRKERPHPGAQLRFTDADGMRVTAFITDTAPGVIAGAAGRPRAAAPSARPRGGPHPRSQGHRTGQPALPRPSTPTPPGSKSSWRQPIWWPGPNSSASPSHPELARCEIATFRYRVLHVAARITRGARQLRLRIDATWRWAAAITTAWHRIRAAFT